MRLEETIQFLYDQYPGLFSSRKEALDQLFCSIGNGYDWDNGQLVASEDIPADLVLILGEDGKAKRSMERLKAKQESYKEEFRERQQREQQLLLNKGLSQDVADDMYPMDEAHLQAFAERMVSLKANEGDYQFSPLSEYSKLFLLPADIQEDWLVGAKETIVLLKEDGHGFGGKPDTWNDWQREQHAKWTEKLNELADQLNIS